VSGASDPRAATRELAAAVAAAVDSLGSPASEARR